MRAIRGLGLLILGSLMLSSCAPARSGVFTVASTKCGADVLGSKFVLVKKNVSADDSKVIFIFEFGTPRDYKTMEKILAETGGDLLTNVRVTHQTKMVYLLMVFGVDKVMVSADVWRIASQAEIDSGSAGECFTLDQIGEIALVRGGLDRTLDGRSSL